MSVKAYGIPTQLHLDPRVVQSEPIYTINRSGDDVTYTNYSANTTTISNISFQFPVNNINTFIDRKIYIHVRAVFQFTGTAVPFSAPPAMFPNGIMNGTDGLRWCPLQNNATAVRLTLDNQAITYESNQFLEALSRYGFDRGADDTYCSMFPSMHDQFLEYVDGFNKNKNPLAEYGDNTAQSTRGDFLYTVLADTGTAATVAVEWTEPLMISPLLFTREDGKGLYSVQNFGLDMTLGPFSRMWSHDSTNGCGIVTLTGAFDGLAQLRVCTLTPSLLFKPTDIQIYPYTEIKRFTTSMPFVPAQSFVTITSTSIQMKDIPSRLYIFARKKLNTVTFNDTDTYLTLRSLTINWNNRAGLLSSATPEDLYSMSIRNGLKVSWNEWNRFIGSVMCVDFGKDIGLSGAESVGLLGTYQMQITATFFSNYLVQVDPELVIVSLDEGVYSANRGQSLISTGMLDQEDVATSKLEKIPLTEFQDITTFYGGSLASIGKNVVEGIYKTGRFAKQHGKELATDVYDLGKKYVPKFKASGYSGGQIVGDDGRQLLKGRRGNNPQKLPAPNRRIGY